ncbi:hypothetical protein AAE478_003105 [Parahypoxylon ruwenzoriense]
MVHPETQTLSIGTMPSAESSRHIENGSELYDFPPERLFPVDQPRRQIYSRGWAPEVQTMYSVPFPVSVIRTRMRQEFERHRFVNKLPVVDVLLAQNNAEYQETMNFWKQTTHIMSYFQTENFRGADRLPDTFMKGFLEASFSNTTLQTWKSPANSAIGSQLDMGIIPLYCT